MKDKNSNHLIAVLAGMASFLVVTSMSPFLPNLNEYVAIFTPVVISGVVSTLVYNIRNKRR